MSQAKVFLACPFYGQVEFAAVQGAFEASRTAEVHMHPRQESRLPDNFNALWCMALNTRAQEGWTHFAMLHSDVAPEAGWLDVLIGEQQRLGASVVSAVIPIKDTRGLTSTAVLLEGGQVKRLTLAEVAELPETFKADDVACTGIHSLLVNTGCWVCDFTQPWVERICFQFVNRIVRREDGLFESHGMPEDWHFSLQCAELGVSVAATRKVRLGHLGSTEYRNDTAWGAWQVDQGGR